MYSNGAVSRSVWAILCILALLPGDTLAYPSPTPQAPASAPPAQAQKISPEQLDSLVAPIALYPDPLLAQTLAASTYPLEIIQLQQWLEKNKTLKDKALADAVAKEPWDPSVQSMAALPEVVNRLANDIQWTTDLGNAFLAQQSDVMDAVQRMRKKAQDKGNLKSTEQQKVETQVIENKSVIVVQQANPQVVYVPTYDPVVIYGAPIYPYPPIYYPPAWYYPTGLAISFGVGVAMGAFWSGGWCCGAGWGGNDITINRNNNFNRNSNISGGNRASQLPSGGGGNLGDRGNAGGGATWAIGGTQAIAPRNYPRAEPAIGAAQVTAPRNYPQTEAAIDGSTTLNIAEAHRTRTAQPRTGLEAPRAVIRLPTVSQALVNRSPARAAILPATREAEPD